MFDPWFSGYTKAEIDQEKCAIKGQIFAFFSASIPFSLVFFPMLISSCPYSSGVNFCGPMYVKKLGTTVRTERINAGDNCGLNIEYGFDGVSNFTNLPNNTKKFYNYIGGDRCIFQAPPNAQCSFKYTSCDAALDCLQLTYFQGQVDTIFFNKDHIEDGNQNYDKVHNSCNLSLTK